MKLYAVRKATAPKKPAQANKRMQLLNLKTHQQQFLNSQTPQRKTSTVCSIFYGKALY